MKKRFCGMIAALLALAVLFATGAYAADDAQTSELLISPTFGQTEARAMLDMVNAFRTGEEAFYWNQSNTELVSSKGEPLSYSYALEEIAMQRAAEIALSFSHTRPDGTRCFSALASDGTSSWGENIAAGKTTASGAFTQWREDDDYYSGQGHRRNMLNTSYKAIGIGHVTLNGTHYWVQEFGYDTDNAPETAALDSECSVTVQAAPARIQSAGELAVSASEMALQVGETAALPTVSASVKLADTWPNRETAVEVNPVWTSGDASVCAVEGQRVSGVAAGGAVLTGAALGKTVSLSVTVGGGGSVPVDYAITDAAPDTDAGTLSVTLTNPDAATLVVAYFADNGEFMSAELRSVGESAGTVTLSLSENAKTARVTLLDSDFRPLCACFAATIG